MPVHKRMNDPYPREEKRAIFEQIRKDYAQRAALKDDNRKRKEEGRPTRTIDQYRADTDPAPPAPPPNSSKKRKLDDGKTAMFDPLHPHRDRLPKAKIPLAKTEAEQEDVRRSRDHINTLHKSGYSTSVTSAVAGVKRKSVFADNMAVAQARIEQAGMKRRAAELDSGRAKKAKPTASFMDYLPKDQDDRKTTPAGSSTAVSPPLKQKSVANTTANAKAAAKAGDLTTPEAKRRKFNPNPCATNVDNKANVAATKKDTIPATASNATNKSAAQKTSEAKGSKVKSESCAPNVATTDNNTTPAATSKSAPKVDDQKTSEAKECESDSKSPATDVDNKANNAATDKDIAVAATPEEGAHVESGPVSSTKAKVFDSIAQSETVSNPDSSDGADTQSSTTDNTSVGTSPAKDSSPVSTSEAPTVEIPGVTESVTSIAGKKRKADEEGLDSSNDPTPVYANDAQTAEKPEAIEGVPSVAGAKRKAEDEGSNPAKRRKLGPGNPYNVLHNYSAACFMNATAHVLHTIPEFATSRNKSSKELEANKILSRAEMKSAVLGKESDNATSKNRRKLRDHLAAKAEGGELKLFPELSNIMKQLSSNKKGGAKINPFVFHQTCGALFTDDDGQPMNGETQQDAHEFILKLLHQLKTEQPELDLDDLFAAHFAEQQVCQCGATKSFTEENSSFPIPDRLIDSGFDFADLVAEYLVDSSKFTYYRCETCGESGRWSPKDDWRSKRMTKTPEYIIAHVPRGQWHMEGNQVKKIKLTNKVTPPMEKISFPTADRGTVDYHMLAMIEHGGRTMDFGHYVTVRKIDGEWFYCDDMNHGGIQALTRAQVSNRTSACIYLLKKGADPIYDRPAA